jgi:hypothetical protein
MLYIDSPCGTGLSVCGTAGMATNESRVAGDLYGALTDFFAKKSPVASSALYLFGESYAGKYIPSLAAALLDKPSAIIPKLEGTGPAGGAARHGRGDCVGGAASAVARGGRCGGAVRLRGRVLSVRQGTEKDGIGTWGGA